MTPPASGGDSSAAQGSAADTSKSPGGSQDSAAKSQPESAGGAPTVSHHSSDRPSITRSSLTLLIVFRILPKLQLVPLLLLMTPLPLSLDLNQAKLML